MEHKYYWVKLFKDSMEFEPAEAREAYSSEEYYFKFTNGSIKKVSEVFEYKPLIYNEN